MVKIKGIIPSEKVYIQLFYFGCIALTCLMVGAIVVNVCFGGATTLPALWWAQLAGAVLMFALPAVLMAYLQQNPDNKAFLHTDTSAINPMQMLTAAMIMAAALPFVNLLGAWNEQLSLPESLAWLEKAMRALQSKNDELTKVFLAADSLPMLLANIFFIALVPAVCEELFFRGALQGILARRLNVHVAVWLTAAVFSAYHLQFFGFVPRLMLGAVLGYMLAWSGSIYVPMLAHFVNNAIVVIASYTLNRQAFHDKTIFDTLGVGEQWWLGTLSALFVVALFIVFRDIAKENQIQGETALHSH